MSIQEILQTLSPINTKEKVDTVIQMANDNHLVFSSNMELSILFAIQKLSIQKYFKDKYHGLMNVMENELKERIKRRTGQERKKIAKEREKFGNTKIGIITKGKKKTKSQKQTKTKYVSSVSRTMKIFGSENKRKDYASVKSQPIDPQKLKPGPTATTRSIRTISIASGGMNKRY